MLKRSPSLVEQVKTYLKQRITRAEFDSGRLPSEADLASELNVSRNTVRDALSRLEMEGVIFRRQGAGTFVNQAGTMVKTRLEHIIPYEILIQEHGFTPSIQLISVVEKPPDLPVSAQLNLAPDEKVLIVQKLFLADAEPIIFTVTAIPTSLIKHPHTRKISDAHLPVLPQFCQQELAYYLSEIAR
jgi:GntR family transcriptional regulator